MSEPYCSRSSRVSCAPFPAVHLPRDRRIDLIRGLAVLAISANHIWYQTQEDLAASGYKFGHVFAFDFADVFVLLSGIVAGLVFFPLLLCGGFQQCCAKSVRRAGQVWAAQIFSVLLALPIILLFEQQLGVTDLAISPFDHPAPAAFAGNLLLYQPSYLIDILPVYIILLLALPMALALFKRSIAAYFALIGSIWIGLWGSVFLGNLSLSPVPPAPETPYFMHPLAAQCIFFTGAAIGIRKAEIEAFLSRYSKTIVPGALLFLLVTNYMAQMEWLVHHFDQKHFAGPLRQAELLAVLAVFWSVTRPTLSIPGTHLVEACGRHTLPVFALTTVGAVFVTAALHWLDAGRLVHGLGIAANVGFCLVCGYVLERRKEPVRHTPAMEIAARQGRYQRPRPHNSPKSAESPIPEFAPARPRVAS